MDLSLYLPDEEWIISETAVTNPIVETWIGVYAEYMQYTFSLKRNPTFYSKMILIPTFLLSLLRFILFWISSTRPDRTAVGG